MGARGAVGGSVMMKTVLQPHRENQEDTVSIELPITEVRLLPTPTITLLSMLGRGVVEGIGEAGAASPLRRAGQQQQTVDHQSGVCDSSAGQGSSQGSRKKRQSAWEQGSVRSNPTQYHSFCSTLSLSVPSPLTTLSLSQWGTVSFQGPVQQLFCLFDHLLSRFRAIRSQTTNTTTLPALPVVAAVCLRLRLLHPDLFPPLRQLEEGREVKDHKLAHCEAVRRVSLRKWPHKNYL